MHVTIVECSQSILEVKVPNQQPLDIGTGTTLPILEALVPYGQTYRLHRLDYRGAEICKSS